MTWGADGTESHSTWGGRPDWVLLMLKVDGGMDGIYRSRLKLPGGLTGLNPIGPKRARSKTNW